MILIDRVKQWDARALMTGQRPSWWQRVLIRIFVGTKFPKKMKSRISLPLTEAKKERVLPSGWTSIEIERLWVRGMPKRLVARHGADFAANSAKPVAFPKKCSSGLHGNGERVSAADRGAHPAPEMRSHPGAYTLRGPACVVGFRVRTGQGRHRSLLAIIEPVASSFRGTRF